MSLANGTAGRVPGGLGRPPSPTRGGAPDAARARAIVPGLGAVPGRRATPRPSLSLRARTGELLSGREPTLKPIDLIEIWRQEDPAVRHGGHHGVPAP